MTAQDFGPRLELAEIPVDLIFTDATYQRDISSRRSQLAIGRMVADFKWVKFGAISVMRWAIEDGYAVIDGQHRTEAARRLGIEAVPALVHPEMTAQEAAKVFVSVNMNRVSVHPMALHYANLAAGDPVAIEIDSICKAAGVTISKYPLMASMLKPGVTMAVGSIRTSINRYGAYRVQEALTLIAKAFEGQSGRIRAEIIVGITAAIGEAADLEAVQRWLSETQPAELSFLIDSEADKGGTSRADAVRRLALKSANRPTGPAVQDQKDGLTLGRPVHRRCDKCNSIFQTVIVAQTACDNCLKGRSAA